MNRAICGTAALCLALSAEAATFSVTTLADAGPGSLRNAVAQANGAPGPDTITFAVTGTIALTSGQIIINEALTITGPGAASLVIDGSGTSRIFTVGDSPFGQCPATSGPSDYLVTVTGVTLRNGRVSNNGGAIESWHSLAFDGVVFEDNVAHFGGAVYMQAQYTGQSLTIANSVLRNNRAAQQAGNSGGVGAGAVAVRDSCAAPDPASVTVAISDTQFHGNRVQSGTVGGAGGAMVLDSLTDAVLTNVRIFDNHVEFSTAGGRGGAMRFTGRSLRFERSEIAENSSPGNGVFQFANSEPGRQGPSDAAKVEFVNTTVANNVTTNGGSSTLVFGNVALELYNSTYAYNVPNLLGNPGILFSKDATSATPSLKLESSIVYNPAGGGVDLIKDATINFVNVTANRSLIGKIVTFSGSFEFVGPGSGNLLGLDPVLGPLAFNGGVTRTRLLLTPSPAIDVGSNPLALAIDQRAGGFARVQGPAPDIGAAEHPSSCAGFLDVTAADSACRNAAWIKNRSVTLGCAVGLYCPVDGVIRDAMAAFMNRLGTALSGKVVGTQSASGPLDPDVDDTFACLFGLNGEIPAAKYPRRAHVDALLAGTATSENGIHVRLMGLLDWGGSELAILGESRATFRNGFWVQVRALGHVDIPAGQPLAVGLLVSRDGLPGSGTLSDSTCNVRVRLESRDGAVAPFDAAAN